jgi:Tfp pilus tip-associated adhesin PilY1
MTPQTRANHTYVIASAVRFSDVFVNGSFSKAFSGGSASGIGVWRTIMLVGRGAGGKSMSALDVTVPGPFTLKSTSTRLPLVIWNRGNPDTNDGAPKTGSNSYNNTVAGANDYNAYLKMGETWSVPAIGFATAANNVTLRRPSGIEHVAWMGSGYSDVTTEGTTFFALDVLTGDVIGTSSQAAHTLTGGSSASGIRNSLAANVAAFASKPLSFNDPSNPNITNPATEKVTSVYFPDLYSRVWKFDPDAPATAPTVFANVSTDGDQPFGNGVALINFNSNSTSPKPHVFFEAGNDRRVALPQGSPFFRMYGYRDEGNGGRSHAAGLRGERPRRVRPATAFSDRGRRASSTQAPSSIPSAAPARRRSTSS